MSFADEYVRQVALLVNIFPIVSSDPNFALKGGSAINLFYQDLPRLSVDIDLVYLPMETRDVAIESINRSLEYMKSMLVANGFRANVVGAMNSRKIYCSNDETTIKIEPNYTIRGTLHSVSLLDVVPKVRDRFGFAKMNVLAFEELYAGKLCAALDRQHPRDLFDVNKLYEMYPSLPEKLIQCFVVYLLGHNRPVHELLDCEIQDRRETFDDEFAGMTDEPCDYAILQGTLLRLKNDLKTRLMPYKKFISDFLALWADFSEFAIPCVQNLPAIQWKLRNLETLRKTNIRKFEMQAKKFEEFF